MTCVCLAPTNRAARNLEGQTMHAFVGFAPPSDDVGDDDIQSDFTFDPKFYQRENHPDVYFVDEASMLDEKLWSVLHDVKTMFSDKIQLVILFDGAQCPPVPGKPESKTTFGQRSETTYMDSVHFVRRKLVDKWWIFTDQRRAECEEQKWVSE